MVIRRAAVLLLLAGPVLPQSLRVLSEFQRVDPFGDVVAVDRTANPREILSPALARNAFASFHIAVSVPERTPYFVYVQTNPPNVFDIALYEELYVKTSAGWIPDALEPTKLPAFGILPYLPMPIPGQNTLSYWMDVWVPAETPVERVRVEVLLKIGQGWMMYPMEARVTPARAPSMEAHSAALPPATARADAAVALPFRNFVCGARETSRDEKLSVRRFLHRNAVQDLALARSLEAAPHNDLRGEILRRLGLSDRAAFCKSSFSPDTLGPEWFLRVRDLLYRKAGPAPD
ncbi:MAG: hypothetical protein LAP39_19775 [Acidobacteriia bacterium]|nr:hypothetical protein [Terriglobia bacterium]